MLKPTKYPCLILLLFISISSFGQNRNLFHIEDFELDGNGTRYTRSHEFDTIGSYFKRGKVSDFLGARYTQQNVQDEYFFSIKNSYGVRPNAAQDAPLNGFCTLDIKQLDISNYDTIFLSYFLSAENASIYGGRTLSFNDSHIDVDYSIDGGGFTNIAKISNSSKNGFSPAYYTIPISDRANVPTSMQLTQSFQEFTDTILNGSGGTTLDVRYVMKTSTQAQSFAIDKIRFRGSIISALPANRVRLLYYYCGYTTDNSYDNIWVSNAGADSYDFEFSGGDIGATPVLVNSPSGTVKLRDAGLNYGQTYNVRVRGIFGGTPGPWSDSWWNSCNIGILAPSAEMATVCGSNISIFQNLYSETMGGATDYRFRINGATVYTTGGDRFFTLDQAGFSSNGSYTVEAAAFIDGAWSVYGNICSYNVVGGAPTINLKSWQCGNTYDLNGSVFTTPVNNATNYQWEITGGLTTTVNTGTRSYLQLSEIPGITYGVSTLQIRVRATVGGLTGSYGSSCGIDVISTLPSRDIRFVCGTTVDANKVMCCEAVYLASGYKFELTGQVDTSIFSVNNCIRFGDFTNLEDGSYSVIVRAYSGPDTASAGNGCSFTYISGTPSSPGKKGLISDVILNDTNSKNYNVYPNPFSRELNFKIIEGETVMFEIINVLGKSVASGTVNSINSRVNLEHLSDGNYILKLYSENVLESTRRIIKISN